MALLLVSQESLQAWWVVCCVLGNLTNVGFGFGFVWPVLLVFRLMLVICSVHLHVLFTPLRGCVFAWACHCSSVPVL
jgi:hypothetical protein